MSAVNALLPAISPSDNRTGSGSGTPDDGSEAFANVLKTVLEKTQASAPPTNPPMAPASTGASKPLAFPQSKSGAGGFSSRAAQHEGEDSTSKASVGAALSPPGGALDPSGLTLAAMVQAAAQAAPSAPRSSDVTQDVPTSGHPGTPATAAAPSPQALATAAAPSAQAPVFQPRPSDAGSAPDTRPGPEDPATAASAAVAPFSIAGSTTSAGDPPAGSVMAALQAVVAAAPVAAPVPVMSAAPASPRPASSSRSPKGVLPDAPAVSDNGPAASQAPTVHALPRASVTAPSKATTSKLPAPVATSGATPWTGAAEAGTAASQVAGALAALAQGSASGPSDPSVAASAGGVGQGTATTAPTGAEAPTSSTTSPSGMREMTIQLDPEHLGSVAITMRMAGGKLQIDIRVAKAQTLDVLNQDRHILSAAVEAAGASRDGFSLGGASDPAPTPDLGRGLAGSGAQDGGSQQQTFSSRGSSDGAGQGPAAGTAAADMTRDEDDEPVSNAVARRLDGSLYV